MTEIKYTFLDDLGTQEFIDIMLELADIHLEKRFSTNIATGTQDDEHIPTALTVMNAFNAIAATFADTPDKVVKVRREVTKLMERIRYMTNTNLSIEFVTGFIEKKVSVPDPYTLYFQRDSASRTVYKLFVWDTALGWIEVGNTEPDLVNYWKRTDLVGLRDAIYSQTHELVLMPDETIRSKVDRVFDKIHGGDR